MSYKAFIRTGHGYENHSTQGRCTAFDGFDVIAAPLHQKGEGWQSAFSDAARESRVFPSKSGGAGVTYASHALKLAKRSGDTITGKLYILMHNGSGREVLEVPSFYDGGDLEAHILAMPERLQYALIYTIWSAANNARYEAQQKTRVEWAQAYVDGRIKKHRATSSRGARVEILQPWQVEKKAKAKAAEGADHV